MPTYHAKDMLERDIEELEARLEKNDRKFRDFKDEVHDLVEREVDRLVAKKVDERIKKTVGDDLNTLVGNIQEKLKELGEKCKDIKEVKDSQGEEKAWWRQYWKDDYFGILEKLRQRHVQGLSARRLHGPPSRKTYSSNGYGRGSALDRLYDYDPRIN